MKIKGLFLAALAAVALSVSACSYSGNDGQPKDHADNHSQTGTAGGTSNHHDDGGASADTGKSGGANR
jgi:hypothetical protein